MKNLARNTQPFYYALCTGVSELTTGEPPVGTGEYAPTYGTATAARGSVSQNTGNAMNNVFGLTEPYDAVITLFGASLGINSTSLIWLDDLVTTNPHDHIVMGVSDSLNSTRIAIKKVMVSA